MSASLPWRRACQPAAVTVRQTGGAVCDVRCRADTLRDQARATTMTLQAGRR
jgi:hypothetical protein